MVGWVLLGAVGSFSVLGVLMNWLWPLLVAAFAFLALFVMGVKAVIGGVGVAVFITVFVLVVGAVVLREWRDQRRTKDWFSKLTTD